MVTRAEVAEIIRQFIDGTGGKWDWDDFISLPIGDPYLDRVRVEAADVQDRYPADKGGYCNEQGVEQLERLIAELTADESTPPAG